MMSITLDLKPEIQDRLQESAARAGITVEDYLLDLLDKAPYDEEPLPRTPGEIINYWERMGVYAAAPGGADAPELSQQWREQEEERQRQRLFHSQ